LRHRQFPESCVSFAVVLWEKEVILPGGD